MTIELDQHITSPIRSGAAALQPFRVARERQTRHSPYSNQGNTSKGAGKTPDGGMDGME